MRSPGDEDEEQFERRLRFTALPIGVLLMVLIFTLAGTGSPYVAVPVATFAVVAVATNVVVWRRRRRSERARRARSAYEPLIVRNPRTGQVGPADAVAGPWPGRIATAIRGTVWMPGFAAESEAAVVELQQRLEHAAEVEGVEFSWWPSPEGTVIELVARVPYMNRRTNGASIRVKGALRAGSPTTFRGAVVRDGGVLAVVLVPGLFLLLSPVALAGAVASLIGQQPGAPGPFLALWGVGAFVIALFWWRQLTLLHERHRRVLQRVFGEGLRHGESGRPQPG